MYSFMSIPSEKLDSDITRFELLRQSGTKVKLGRLLSTLSTESTIYRRGA